MWRLQIFLLCQRNVFDLTMCVCWKSTPFWPNKPPTTKHHEQRLSQTLAPLTSSTEKDQSSNNLLVQHIQNWIAWITLLIGIFYTSVPHCHSYQRPGFLILTLSSLTLITLLILPLSAILLSLTRTPIVAHHNSIEHLRVKTTRA